METCEEFTLEIVVPTYGHPQHIKNMLSIYQTFQEYSSCFSVSIYDSSPDDLTEQVVRQVNLKNIKYVRLSSEIDIDDKTVIALHSAQASFIMLCGDGYAANVPNLLKIINSSAGAELIVLYDLRCAPQAVFFSTLKYTKTDIKDKFMEDNFWQLILYGGSICNRELIEKFDQSLLIKKYSCTGFIYPAALAMYAQGPFQIEGGNFLIDTVFQREAGWVKSKRLMPIWTKNFCYVLDQLKEVLSDSARNTILKTIGTRTTFFTVRRLIGFRISDNFNYRLLRQYKQYFKHVKGCSMSSAYLIAICPKCFLRYLRSLYRLLKKDHVV